MGLEEARQINQVANYALVEWTDNVAISDRPPKDYVPPLEARFSPAELQCMYALHALPDRWYEMDYDAFLAERRKRMAAVVWQGYERLLASNSA